jgi:murein DD-endopeptidase MepM/ murein hydrolase activator NlpD
METFVHRLQVVVACALLLAILAMTPVLVSAATSQSGGTNDNSSATASLASSPNAISRGFAGAITGFNRASNSTTAAIGSGARTISNAVLSTSHFAAQSGLFALHSVAWLAVTSYHGTASAIGGIGHGALAVVSTPGRIFHHATRLSAGSLISPADDVSTPRISSDAAVFAAAAETQPKAKIAVAAASSKVIWPLHGAITTLFGVPEPPYQPIHTGIDISDGEPSGVSPIHAFKAGRVVAVIHEHIKLGNEVVIDHGSGLTSVYGHMYSISVRVGQRVTTATVLGTEGTTGVSTGPHLHFEIRINGVPKNPLNFIPGRP